MKNIVLPESINAAQNAIETTLEVRFGKQVWFKDCDFAVSEDESASRTFRLVYGHFRFRGETEYHSIRGVVTVTPLRSGCWVPNHEKDFEFFVDEIGFRATYRQAETDWPKETWVRISSLSGHTIAVGTSHTDRAEN